MMLVGLMMASVGVLGQHRGHELLGSAYFLAGVMVICTQWIVLAIENVGQ